jgi:PIN domain nuclease of toxin-antitoxin system
VFIEIYEKWLRGEEFCRRFFYEVFVPLRESPNVEIRAIDKEALEKVMLIGGSLARHDLHDRLVLACAMTVEAELLTTDDSVAEYVRSTGILPGVLR